MKFRISAWAIRNPIPVAIFFVALTIAGLIAYGRLSIKHYPNISLPVAAVTVSQAGAAPSEMENQITRPIEDAIASVTNVKHISSNVSLGVSITSIEFELGTDMQKATDDVRSVVDRTRVILPPSIDPPVVQRIEVDSVAPILTYAVASDRMTPTELSWFVDNTVARALQAQTGVAQVSRVGGVDREINVTLNPDRMRAFGVTAPQVNGAMTQFNADQAGGRANVGGQEQTVRVLGQAQTVEQLRNLTIPAAGRYVRLADVAEVGDGAAETRGFARLGNRPAVAFQVSKTREASDVTVEKAAVKEIDALAKAHPEVRFSLIVSTVEQTRETYTATVHVLIEGMLLAALVVFLFLRNWRATLIAAAAMPLSLIPTFAAIQLMGFSLNMITLLSLTLVIGILVDDAIVEIENIEKRIERGATPYRAALIGADSIGLAVIATTASIVVVFTPVSFMPGIPGQFFKEFGLTVAVAVVFSLIVARLLTPLMAAYFLKPGVEHKPVRPLSGFYKKSLDWALGHKWISAVLGGALFVGTVLFVGVGAATGVVPVGFQPVENPGFFYLNVEGPPGADRQDMERVATNTTRLLQQNADVAAVFTQIGSTTSGGFGPGSSGGSGGDLRAGTITVMLKKDRHHTTEQVKEHHPPAPAHHPRRAGDHSRRLRLRRRGDRAFRRQRRGALARADPASAGDARPEGAGRSRAPRLPPPRPRSSSAPSPRRPHAWASPPRRWPACCAWPPSATSTPTCPSSPKGERRLPIRVRLADSDRADLDVVKNLQVPTATGATTLDSVADVSFQAGPGQIVRYQRQRRASVQADLNNGASLGTALQAVHRLPVMKKLPAGITEAPIGNAEALQQVIGGFFGAIFAGIALIFGVLVLLFRSFFKPVIILAALPLTLFGAVAGITIARLEIDMPVFIGLLMLMGIAAKNSILLVEFAIEDERAGQNRWDAIHNACRERARPIVMTTVAMIAGMFPTALGVGQGSEFRQPMAVAVIGGLISSTVLSLVLVPVIYLIVDGFEQWLVPKLGFLVTRKQPGDDAPIREDEETLATDDHGSPAPVHHSAGHALAAE